MFQVLMMVLDEVQVEFWVWKAGLSEHGGVREINGSIDTNGSELAVSRKI